MKDMRLAAIIVAVLSALLALIEAMVDGWTLFFFLAAALIPISVASAIYLETRVRYYRAELKKIPREHRGHQDEPGSWQCECGRYNTEYRSACIGCGREKQLRPPF